MSQPAIKVENLSKHYKIGARSKGAYLTLRESLTDAVTSPFRRLFSRNGHLNAQRSSVESRESRVESQNKCSDIRVQGSENDDDPQSSDSVPQPSTLITTDYRSTTTNPSQHHERRGQEIIELLAPCRTRFVKLEMHV